MKSTDRLSTYIPMSPLNTFFYVFTPSRIAGCRKSYSKINHSFPSPILIENQPEIIERDEDCLCVISNAYKEILNLILRKQERRAKLRKNKFKENCYLDHKTIIKKTQSSNKLNIDQLKDKLQSSENLLLCNSNSEEQLCNAKMHRRSSENSGFILNLNNKISITNNANMQQSTIENEQQSSSIPNVSCDLNLANDEERLGQPTPCRINNSQETMNVNLNSQMNNSTFVSQELDSTLSSQYKSQTKAQKKLAEISSFHK